jgi:hypothetical protein
MRDRIPVLDITIPAYRRTLTHHVTSLDLASTALRAIDAPIKWIPAGQSSTIQMNTARSLPKILIVRLFFGLIPR